jgi:UDPglucose--hexose-1-phosphate uridylyltransferase
MLVWCPRVSRFSYETRIAARDLAGRFEEASDERLQALGVALKQTLRRLEIALDDPPLNFILHTTPFGEERTRGPQWWFEIIPRLSGIGGFELGSGCFITTTFPEEAARRLREIPVAEL